MDSRRCQQVKNVEDEIDLSGMESCVKKRMPLGYVLATDILPERTPITIRIREAMWI